MNGPSAERPGAGLPDASLPETAVIETVFALSYDDFYRRELPAMTALATAVSGRPQLAEDIAQDALIKAYRKWDQVGRYEKPGAWLRRVTINKSLSARKRASAEVRARLRMTEPSHITPTAPDFDHVWAAVAQLPGNQRAAVALHYLEDLPVAEIADILNCSESTARVHLHRGRTALATQLQETTS